MRIINSLKFIGLTALSVGVIACSGDDEDNNSTNNNTNNNTGNLDSRITCNGDICTVPADTTPYTESMTWTADKTWVLDPGGQAVVNVTIGSGATLTVEPGTVVQALGQMALVIDRGAKIMADGTAENPIVFTSANSPGSRAPGDWGGMIINGNAPASCNPCEGEGNSGQYGGSNAADDSGVLRYVRVEYGGNQITDEDQYNGVAFQGVGSGTTIDYVHAHNTADDGFEFFGGTVNAKHLIVTNAGDDSVDWVFGWQGNLQHVLVQQASNAGDRGIEADSNRNSPDIDPRSMPVISNITICGRADDQGILLRRGTGAQIWNGVVKGSNQCFDVDGIPATFDQVSGGGIVFANTYFDCNESFVENDEDDGMDPPTDVPDADSNGPVDLSDVISGGTNFNEGDPGIPCGTHTSPNWMPTAGAAVNSGGGAPSDAFFDASTHIGGMAMGNDWTTWTSFDAN